VTTDVALLRKIMLEATIGSKYLPAAEQWCEETIDGKSAVGSVRRFLELVQAEENRARIVERRDRFVDEQLRGYGPGDDPGPQMCLSPARPDPEPTERKRRNPLLALAIIVVVIAIVAALLLRR
jgi:hypothetical protein